MDKSLTPIDELSPLMNESLSYNSNNEIDSLASVPYDSKENYSEVEMVGRPEKGIAIDLKVLDPRSPIDDIALSPSNMERQEVTVPNGKSEINMSDGSLSSRSTTHPTPIKWIICLLFIIVVLIVGLVVVFDLIGYKV